MEQLPGWGWRWGLLKLPGPGGGALVVAGSSCPYLAFLSRLGVAQQTRDRHISSVTREPGSWPHLRPDEPDVRCRGTSRRTGPCPTPCALPCRSQHCSAIPQQGKGLPAAPMLCVCSLHQPKKEAVNTKPGNSRGHLKFQKRRGVSVQVLSSKNQNKTEHGVP